MVEKIILSNGVRVLCEPLDHVRSCAIGLWVENGSCHEPEALAGISHFIEHMLFKGTQSRSAGDLAREFDAIGGQVNAYTTKEHTCYYARTLDTHVRKAAELLCDMYLHSAFSEEAIDLERGVILEEIGMYEDTPEDLVCELLSAACYPGQALGRPILGTAETLKGIGHREISDYCKRNYTAANTILSLCGSYSQEDLKAVCDAFSTLPAGQRLRLPDARYQKALVLKKKEIEQNHLLLAFPAITADDPRRYPLAVLNNILGAGMSSRLFQRVREQSGLCYTVYSFTSLYAPAGTLGIYVALGKETELSALKLIREELLRFREEGVAERELSGTKEQLKASLLMGLESTNTRTSTMARNEMLYGEIRTPDQVVEQLERVTAADVLSLAREILDFDRMAFSVVGNPAGEEAYRAVLEQ